MNFEDCNLQTWNFLCLLTDVGTHFRLNFKAMIVSILKLWIFKVGKLDACGRRPGQNIISALQLAISEKRINAGSRPSHGFFLLSSTFQTHLNRLV